MTDGLRSWRLAKAARSRVALALGLSIALAAALLAATLGALAAAQPVSAQPSDPLKQHVRQPLAPSTETLSMAKLATTGSGDNAVVFNGQRITYTIVITNNSTSNTAVNISVLDVLPSGTLDQINCISACQPIFVSQQVPEPLGGTVLVTVTTQLSWTVASLAPQDVRQLVFSARVAGQTDGTIFKNRAFATYTLGGNPGAVSTPDVATTVRAQIVQLGQPSVSNAPTWFSTDLGGTLSQDWGDFDGDGQLDLVLGSSLGVSVYKNVGGQLKPYWNNFSLHRRAYGVRWADVNHNGKLEIVAVGDSLDGTAVTSGTNYIYGQASGAFTQVGSFTSEYQMVRVAVGNFTGHGNTDIIASTNSLNANCPVRLFVNDGAGNFAASPTCVSQSATAALGPGDFDNNGTLDLAVGLFPSTIEILRNDGTGNFTTLAPVVVDNNLPFLPYDFAWGDYDGNGLLDLAAAFPLQKQAVVYRNLGNGTFDTPLAPFHTTKFLSPLAVSWADFNGDGTLDLAVADEIPKVYLNHQGQFDLSSPLAAASVSGQVWSLRSPQIDNSGGPQLSLTDRDGPSLLFGSFGANLATSLTPVNGSSAPASSLAVGDMDGSGTIDMLFGAAPLPVQGTEIDYGSGGTFPTQLLLPSGPGPQSVAVGDINGDGQLDVVVGTAVEAQLYLAGQTAPAWTASAPNGPNHVVALCDVNSDGKLDLLVGANGTGVAVYLNQGGVFADTPAFVTAETGNVKAIACADFQHSHYPGFAVGFDNQPVYVYSNNRDNTFSVAFSTSVALKTTSLAWGDFNHAGYPSLAVGTFQQGTQIYENHGGVMQNPAIWTSPTQWRTTSIAWGDWNNDGYLDLGIGNDSQPAQVYGNLGSSPGQPRLFWLWTASDSYPTTGIAWGDFSGDGHLDLGLSQNGACCNGYYHNGTIAAAHLTSNYVSTLSLPVNPTYLYVKRPGQTADAYGNSSSEVVGGGSVTTPITIAYTLYDPNGSRNNSVVDAAGHTIENSFLEYSLDGGSTWLTATPGSGWTGPVTTTSRLGTSASFPWDITKDQAISDDARFRVRVVPYVPYGPVDSSQAVAVSPPFVARGTTCVWPQNPAMTISQNPISPTVPAGFFGSISAGTGALTYTWNFGDGLPTDNVLGQVASHAYAQNGTYTVTLMVSGQPCPQNRDVVVKQRVTVSNGQDFAEYLPLLQGGSSSAGALAISHHTAGVAAAATIVPDPMAGVAVNPSLVRPPTRPRPAAPASSPPLNAGAITTSTVGTNNEPSLNEDGTRIAYWSTADPTGNNGDGSIEVFLVVTDTSGITVTQITSSTGSILGGFNLSPSIDGTGTRVAFFSDRDLVGQNSDNSFQIFLYDATTQVLTQVTHTTRGFNILPSISSDGQYIAFASDRDLVPGHNTSGNTQIFRAHILPNGTFAFVQVTNTPGGTNDQPRINQDGSRIAFVSDNNLDPTPPGNPQNLREVYLAAIGPSGQVTFTQVTHTSSGTTGQPSIDADGQRVAFVSDRSPNGQGNLNQEQLNEIFYADVVGPGNLTVTQVTTSSSEIGNAQPSISDDGTRIGFISPVNGLVRVWDTITQKMITTTAGSGLLSVSLSGDGTVVGYALNRELYLSSNRLTRLKLTKVAPSGTIFQGQLFSYTVTLTNTGPSLATNVILTDTLGAIAGAKPAPGWVFNGFTLDSPVGGSCTTTTGTPVTCTIGTLPAKATVKLSIGISTTTYGTLTNTASVSTDTFQRTPQPDVNVTVTTLPLPVAAVSLTLNGPTTGIALQPNTFIANVTPVTASVPLTYTWTATNQADRTFTSTVFSDSETYTWNPGGVQLVTVTVTNAALNVVSATQTITISNPAPVLSSISPMTALVNSPQLTLVLTGTGFVANSSVLWNGAPLATTFVVSGSLTAVVPANDLTATGNDTVAVLNPGPGGGLSNALNFLVEYPSPVLTSLQPNTAARGGPAITLSVNGSNFVNGASLYFGNQVPLTTVFGSSNLLTATIPASYLLLAAGQVPITVTNPSPSVGPSNTLQFLLTDPTLSLTINPASIDINQTTTLTATISDVQAADRTITLTSSNNSIGSVPATITLPTGTTSVTATVQGGVAGFAQITGTLPANIGGQSGSATLTVNNLTPTISQASPVTITAGGPAFILTLTGSNFVNGASLFWGAQPALTLVGNGTAVTTVVPASYIATPGPVVLNALNPAPSDGASGSFTYNVISPTISLAPSELDLSVLGTGTFTATISAVQAANRSIAITPTTGLLLSPPSSITLLAGTTAITFNVTGGRSGGTGFITATLPASLGGLFDTSTITVANTTPTISLITPSTVTVGTQAVLDVTGSGFVSTSKVRWNGNNNSANVPTGFVDSGHLTATVDATLFPTVGDYPVTVFNPNPGGGTSNVFTVTAVNPSPVLSSMSPVTALVNSSTFNLSVTGSQFVNGASSIYWNNQPQTTNFVDSSHLTASVPASDLLSRGEFPIVVSTTAPGGGVSGPLTFTVVTTQPVITKIAPITGTINTASFTLVVTGTGFVNPPATSADSVIQVNNSAVATSFVNSGELTATIVPSIDTPTIGIYTITVLNPQPPNGPDRLSNVVNFTVTNPLPLLVSMSPTTATAGDATFNLTLTGSQFTSRDSTVLWAGAPLATTFITPQTLTAVVDSR